MASRTFCGIGDPRGGRLDAPAPLTPHPLPAAWSRPAKSNFLSVSASLIMGEDLPDTGDLGVGERLGLIRDEIADFAKDVRKVVRKIDASKVKDPDEDGPAAIMLDGGKVDALRGTQVTKDANVVDSLVPLIGVLVYGEGGTSGHIRGGGYLGDEGLLAIGLPAVDAILKSAVDGKLRPWQHKSAYEIVLEIGGNEEVLQGRAKFLGLKNNPKVVDFLAKRFAEPTSRPAASRPATPAETRPANAPMPAKLVKPAK